MRLRAALAYGAILLGACAPADDAPFEFRLVTSESISYGIDGIGPRFVRCETCDARQVVNLWGERSEVLAEREARATLATDEIESLVLSEKERLHPPGQRFVAIEAVPVVEAESRLGRISREYPDDQLLISHQRLPPILSPTIGWPRRVLIARVLTMEQARKLANELGKPFVELIYDAEAAERARDQIRDAIRRLEEEPSQR